MKNLTDPDEKDALRKLGKRFVHHIYRSVEYADGNFL